MSIYGNQRVANKNEISQIMINQVASAQKIEDIMKSVNSLSIENVKLQNINDLFQSKLDKNMFM